MKNIKQIKKVIIPAAGWGTRFLPLTKVVEKELLPILNKPAIDYLVRECIESQIEEVIIVISETKKAIKKYFESNSILEKLLLRDKKNALYKLVLETNSPCKLIYIIQEKQLGLGHAIATASERIDSDEPFGIILGDDLLYGETPGIKQLINAYNETGSSILGVQKIPYKNLFKYGIVIPKGKINNDLFEITGAIEKPKNEDAPSEYAIIGRYLFVGKFMKMLKKLKYIPEKEINVVDAFDELLKTEKLYAYNIDAIRYDLGSKEGFVKATIDYALRDSEIQGSIKEFLNNKKDLF